MWIVYIAGPYSADPDLCTKRAIDAGHAVMDLGMCPIVPHLSHFMHMQRNRPYEEWMSIDFEYITTADFLWRLPGDSPGADREVELAKKLGIPVVSSLEDLKKAVGKNG
jgi:hypothetical protein